MLLSLLLSAPVVLYITYLAVPGSSLFSWHPVCMSLCFVALMSAGIEAFSRSAVSNPFRQRSRVTRLTLHWVVQGAAVSLALAGLASIYLNKERRGAAHFTSQHGYLGLICVAYTVIQATGGVLAMWWSRLRLPGPSPRTMKTLHATSGTALVCLAQYVAWLGVNSAWSHQVADPSARLAAAPLLALAALHAIYRLITERCTPQKTD